MKVIFFDTECLHSPGDGDYNFKHPEELRLSVCATIDKEGGEKQWLGPHIHDLIDYLKSADILVGFNCIKFDLPLLHGEQFYRGAGDMLDGATPGMTATEHFASFEGVRDSLAWSIAGERGKIVDMFMDVQAEVGRKKGTGLKPLAECTLDMQAPMEGDHAPVAWAQQRLLEVIEYCTIDVRMSRALFNHVHKHGTAKRQNDRGKGPAPHEFKLGWTLRSGSGKSQMKLGEYLKNG